jgi:hypothetical protein
MKKTNEQPIYRIIFVHQEDLQEIYAQYISEETLVGFIEADSLLELNQTQPILNTKEVRRCYIPLHNIIRIDEIFLQSTGEARDNVSHLPHAFKKSKERK